MRRNNLDLVDQSGAGNDSSNDPRQTINIEALLHAANGTMQMDQALLRALGNSSGMPSINNNPLLSRQLGMNPFQSNQTPQMIPHSLGMNHNVDSVNAALYKKKLLEEMFSVNHRNNSPVSSLNSLQTDLYATLLANQRSQQLAAEQLLQSKLNKAEMARLLAQSAASSANNLPKFKQDNLITKKPEPFPCSSLAVNKDINSLEPTICTDGQNYRFQQNLGCFRAPCPARGMPIDHNFKTAYFVLSEDMEHGEELICSYTKCRSNGIKFRYCAFCKVPVAKRNFFKKHAHTEDKKAKSNEAIISAPVASAAAGNGKNKIDLSTIAKVRLSSISEKIKPPTSSTNTQNDAQNTVTDNPIVSSTGDPADTVVVERVKKSGPPKKRSRMIDTSNFNQVPSPVGPAPSSNSTPIPQSQKSVSDNANIKEDNNNALLKSATKSDAVQESNISSSSSPVVPESNNTKSNNSQQESLKIIRETAWAALLYQRPTGEQTEEFNKWLRKVIDISNPSTK